MVYANEDSLLGKLDELKTILIYKMYHFVCIMESIRKQNMSNVETEVKDYVVYHENRNQKAVNQKMNQ